MNWSRLSLNLSDKLIWHKKSEKEMHLSGERPCIIFILVSQDRKPNFIASLLSSSLLKFWLKPAQYLLNNLQLDLDCFCTLWSWTQSQKSCSITVLRYYLFTHHLTVPRLCLISGSHVEVTQIHNMKVITYINRSVSAILKRYFSCLVSIVFGKLFTSHLFSIVLKYLFTNVHVTVLSTES